ncbi:hypothetical protein [Hyphococcus sp.]|uniref:hypothetical protein n=1 Tax=Hyphococcus sp. TaxID=2038636 RepID=UPI0035C6DF1C
MRHGSGGANNVVRLNYDYDARRKVTSVTDDVNAGEDRAFTYDYNGRLLTASGPWGSGSFTYDALSNLRQQTLGSRTITVAYDGTNRVSSANDNGSVKSYAYDAPRAKARSDFACRPSPTRQCDHRRAECVRL